VFRGVGDITGSILEVRGSGDEYRVFVDGALSERVVADRDFTATGPPLTWCYGDVDYRDTFDVSEDARDALATFVDAGAPGSPPWDVATELFADGLIDIHWALTPRGRRALVRSTPAHLRGIARYFADQLTDREAAVIDGALHRVAGATAEGEPTPL
jgi:hypothetical protein